mmetsp:Transcript_23582/g.32327  ORF Transcript_23582/g.32327 Transcript_23582/m.32327 type:complete len:243 (-) Transcript_23582:1488-2216(-)
MQQKGFTGPPPPPKRKNRQAISTSLAVGSAFNAINTRSMNISFSSSSIEGPCAEIYKIIPDTTIGHGIEVNGEMEFNRLLRIDGRFKGTLSVAATETASPSTSYDDESMGNLIIGENGIFIGNIGTSSCQLKCVIVEGGEVIGNISVEELVLLKSSKITGSISCRHCAIGPDVTILSGSESVNINPLAPDLIDEDDNVTAIEAETPATNGKASWLTPPKEMGKKNFSKEQKVRGRAYEDDHN